MVNSWMINNFSLNTFCNTWIIFIFWFDSCWIWCDCCGCRCWVWIILYNWRRRRRNGSSGGWGRIREIFNSWRKRKRCSSCCRCWIRSYWRNSWRWWRWWCCCCRWRRWNRCRNRSIFFMRNTIFFMEN